MSDKQNSEKDLDKLWQKVVKIDLCYNYYRKPIVAKCSIWLKSHNLRKLYLPSGMGRISVKCQESNIPPKTIKVKNIPQGNMPAKIMTEL